MPSITSLRLLALGLALLPACLANPVASAKNCVPLETRSIAQIYAAAQKEDGHLNVAWGGDELSQAAGIIQSFNAAFPKIKLNVTVDLSKYHDSRINRGRVVGDTSYADIAVIQTLHDFDLWKAQGYLKAYKPATYDKFWPTLRDGDDGYFMPFVVLSFGGFIYNTKKVAPADVPKSYADLLNPKWKGKIVLAYPNDDDAINFLFSLIVQKHGYSWFEKLAAQDVQWVRGTQTPSTILAQDGQRVLSFTTFAGAPILNQTYPTTDNYMIWPQTMAILASTKRPETAKLFISFLASDDVQKASFRGMSARPDLGPSVFKIPNASPTAFRKFMNNRAVAEDYRMQWETTIGTAQGLSPLHDNL